MLAAARRRAPRGGTVVGTLLAVAVVSARVPSAAAGDFFSPFAPMLAPIINSICETVACGKGNCTVESGSTVLGYRCECDPGWTQLHVGDALRFMPCVVPNCTIDRECSNVSSAPAPAPLPAPRNFTLDDPCEFAYCGTGGTCRKGSGLRYHCQCKEGFGNLLNITSMPCFQDCSFGADCASIGILPSTNSYNSPAPPVSDSSSNNGNSALPGSISRNILVPLLLLVVSLAACEVI